MDGKEISQSSHIDDLKQGITEAVAAVTCDMLQRVWEMLEYRSDICCTHMWGSH
jgi:tRNA(Ile2) C34 agmatinyltransferase TiaS